MVYEDILKGDAADIDPKLLSIALRAMTDMDRTIKNKQTNANHATDASIAEENNELLASILLAHKTQTVEPVKRKLIELPQVDLELVPGESE